jgi:hypothetical protein
MFILVGYFHNPLATLTKFGFGWILLDGYGLRKIIGSKIKTDICFLQKLTGGYSIRKMVI